jgi:hypothetical protein
VATTSDQKSNLREVAFSDLKSESRKGSEVEGGEGAQGRGILGQRTWMEQPGGDGLRGLGIKGKT